MWFWSKSRETSNLAHCGDEITLVSRVGVEEGRGRPSVDRRENKSEK